MRNAHISRRNTNTLNILSRILGTTQVTVDLSAPGVVIPVCPKDGTITLDFTIATKDLRGGKTGVSAVYDFEGVSCEIFFPLSAIQNVEFVPASMDVAERALRLVAQPRPRR